MTINQKLITRKLNYIARDLQRLAKYEQCNLEKYLEEYDIQLRVERLLELIIMRVLDINYHILSDHQIVPKDYRESFLLIAEHKLTDSDLARELSKSAGLRNILSHEYDAIDPAQVHAAIPMALKQIPKYLKQLTQHS